MATSRRAATKPTDKPEGDQPTEAKDTSPKTSASKPTAAKDTAKAEQTYTGRAAALADEVRAAADKIREQVEAVNGKVLELQQDMMPRPGEARVAGGVRRIPMATGDVSRAAEGLLAAAVDLQRRAT